MVIVAFFIDHVSLKTIRARHGASWEIALCTRQALWSISVICDITSEYLHCSWSIHFMYRSNCKDNVLYEYHHNYGPTWLGPYLCVVGVLHTEKTCFYLNRSPHNPVIIGLPFLSVLHTANFFGQPTACLLQPLHIPQWPWSHIAIDFFHWIPGLPG